MVKKVNFYVTTTDGYARNLKDCGFIGCEMGTFYKHTAQGRYNTLVALLDANVPATIYFDGAWHDVYDVSKIYRTI